MIDDDTDAKLNKRNNSHRSPSYPIIDLKSALDRARAFYRHEKRSPASVTVAVHHWGYAASSSGGKQTLAALIAYGLMEDKGSSEHRQVRLTELAFRILLDERPESIERKEALRHAALLPKIHSELYARWSDELPSNPNLRHYLLIEKKFNENAVDDFIRQFRATVEFAEVYSSIVPNDTPLQFENNDTGITAPVTAASPITPPVTRLMHPASLISIASPSLPASPVAADPGQVRQDTFSLNEGQVVLIWPTQLSEESYEDLKDWLELQLRKIRRSVQTTSQNDGKPL